MQVVGLCVIAIFLIQIGLIWYQKWLKFSKLHKMSPIPPKFNQLLYEIMNYVNDGVLIFSQEYVFYFFHQQI